MTAQPVHKRDFQAFLSHAHADKSTVDRLYAWLHDTADIPIWYDAANLPTGTMIGTYLAEAITQCRSLIIVLSEASVKSGWVKEEYNAALGQRTQFEEFRIIPIRFEECEVPGFLQTTKWLDIAGGQFDIIPANDLLASLYYDDVDLGLGKNRDIYISRTWRENEADQADIICRLLVKAGFRLIGDSKDQEGFAEGQRVESIISSCGGLVAILPDRGQGKTSKYMLKEIEIARDLNLPYLIVKESTVDLPGELANQATEVLDTNPADDLSNSAALQNGIELLGEEWVSPAKPHYIFFGTDFDDTHTDRNRAIKQTIQRVTAMPCVMGDEIRSGQIQRVITERISEAFMMIADISAENINTCIEAGIARGARTRFHLVASEPRRRPPFMFRHQQVWHYADDVDLLGKIHRIVYPYRRRVLNWELPA
jgi:hypothetical protein